MPNSVQEEDEVGQVAEVCGRLPILGQQKRLLIWLVERSHSVDLVRTQILPARLSGSHPVRLGGGWGRIRNSRPQSSWR